MEIKLTKDDIKKSLEAKWRKKHFLMFLIIYVIASLLVFFGVHFYPSNKQVVVDSNLPLGLAEIFMFLVFGSFALYYLVRYILLFKQKSTIVVSSSLEYTTPVGFEGLFKISNFVLGVILFCKSSLVILKEFSFFVLISIGLAFTSLIISG